MGNLNSQYKYLFIKELLRVNPQRLTGCLEFFNG